LPRIAKQKRWLRLNGTYEEFMRTSILHDTFTATGHSASLQSSPIAQAAPVRDDRVSKAGMQIGKRSALELAWFLIFLLLFVYFAGSYLFWARIESVWPFGY
jgi:hypothetical protein